eukprot:CAMPEP_0182526190 /NCGR_PEP_ID=MMETSP1323-20130603/3007_1 /TAXON_ID=236787 /ORGANISM="Florenciella parvula, Strain RCC1693" /LENGTH=77 /DNA_ID=CAMNT_0024735005 /DNA_START=140 /DNA_END=369 /DNA_ORIENTATION=-
MSSHMRVCSASKKLMCMQPTDQAAHGAGKPPRPSLHRTEAPATCARVWHGMATQGWGSAGACRPTKKGPFSFLPLAR